MAKNFSTNETVEIRYLPGTGEPWTRAIYIRKEEMPALWQGPGVHVVRLKDGRAVSIPARRIRKLLQQQG